MQIRKRIDNLEKQMGVEKDVFIIFGEEDSQRVTKEQYQAYSKDHPDDITITIKSIGKGD